MRKCLKRVGVCFLVAAMVWLGMLITDRNTLRTELVRLHVVADSDSQADQTLKLRVRDAVNESLKREMANLTDPAEARQYLQENLPKIEALANRVLREAGCGDVATVRMQAEAFTARVYDTFTLPAGIYDALRITIGSGQGQNWWCVVFPGLCYGASEEEFEEIAGCAGLSDALVHTLEGKEGYEIRFYLLDLIGRMENLLYRG